VLVGLAGVALVVLAVVRAPSPPAAPRDVPRSETSPRQATEPAARKPSRVQDKRGVQDLITGPVLPAARPLEVTIPRIHVASRLVRLGVDGQGAMEVPQDPATAGWFHLGPTPGALGPAVIAGHVTWDQVPAVFFRLAELRHGDLVEVTRSDDRVAVFKVTRVTRFAKSRFPTRAVFGGTDHAGLRLITCGGRFDRSSHRYRDNVVAFATLVSAHPAGHQEGGRTGRPAPS
jgi:sortase (surface protein transpeptidase)